MATHIYVGCFFIFLFLFLGFSIVLSSVWPYLQEVRASLLLLYVMRQFCFGNSGGGGDLSEVFVSDVTLYAA